MKLTKPEYNENVTDVDGLEKARIHEEAETERNLTIQVETTKRKVLEEQESTKRQLSSDKEKTKQGDNYLFRMAWFSVAVAIASIAFAIAGYNGYDRYTELEKEKIHAPPCPQVSRGSLSACPQAVTRCSTSYIGGYL